MYIREPGYGKEKKTLNRMYMNMEEIQNHSKILVMSMSYMCIYVDGVKTIWQNA